ncbi:PAS domain S-box protein [Rapidithrix thailandica]|uniref:PAS domain S-box protein n=1 Tax=Rapidithrix thailandica TaxID=413964 RepID=A0AAW9SGE7_9BACT
MNASITLRHDQLDRLFPFYLMLDRALNVVSYGQSLTKLCPVVKGSALESLFELKKPVLKKLCFEELQPISGQLVVLEFVDDRGFYLRGQFEAEADHRQLLFIGSPWVESTEQAQEKGLNMDDFASYDPLTRLLDILKSHKVANEDIKRLFNSLYQQNDRLKQSQQELQRLSLVAKANQHGVLFTRPNGQISWSNEEFLSLTGYDMQDVLGKTPIELCMGPNTKRKVVKEMVELYERGGAVDLEMVMYRKNKSWFWGNVKIQPLRNEQAETVEFFSIVEDITERKMAEEKLRKSEASMSMLIDNLQVGVLFEDENHRVVLINRKYCDLFGIRASPESLIGVDWKDLTLKNKNLFKDPEEFVWRKERILYHQLPVLAEELELKNGRFLERDYIPIFVDGVYKGHLWKFNDITARKNYERTLKVQEEKYRNIIANMNLGIIEVDQEDTIHFANHSFCEMSGYSFEDLLGQKASRLLLKGGSVQVVQTKNKLRETGLSDLFQLPIYNKQGEQRWWIISGAPNYNDAGEFIGSIGIHLDITEQKKMEQDLELAKQKAEESSKAKESFLANMSHEIRTPLNAIIGIMRDLARDQLTTKQNKYLRYAETAAQHLLSIINSILDISKIEAGEFQLDKIHFSMHSVIEETVAIMTVNARQKSIGLEVIIANHLPAALIGDPVRIRQLLINLLGNSIKFTEEGQVSIDCQSTPLNEHQHQIHISITDTGVGMDKNFMENIFKKFSQEENSAIRKYGGTGLGMAITYELIQLMGGSIQIASEKHQGTQIDIYLPLEVGDVQQIVSVVETQDFGVLQNLKILLVEDNELNRMVAENSLTYYGCKIQEAENGLVAIDRVKKNKYDVILMDLQMPGMDGIEATKVIRKDLKITTPIIALTANAFQKEIDYCMQSGMNGYVTKPFEESKLLGSILKAFRASQASSMKVTKNTLNNAKTMSSERLYDLSKLIEASRGNEEFVKKMVALFIEQIPPSLLQIKEAYQQKDLATVHKITHRIKPSIINMGIHSIVNEVREIELMAKEERDVLKLATMLNFLDEVLNKVLKQLKQDNFESKL